MLVRLPILHSDFRDIKQSVETVLSMTSAVPVQLPCVRKVLAVQVEHLLIYFLLVLVYFFTQYTG